MTAATPLRDRVRALETKIRKLRQIAPSYDLEFRISLNELIRDMEQHLRDLRRQLAADGDEGLSVVVERRA